MLLPPRPRSAAADVSPLTEGAPALRADRAPVGQGPAADETALRRKPDAEEPCDCFGYALHVSSLIRASGFFPMYRNSTRGLEQASVLALSRALAMPSLTP